MGTIYGHLDENQNVIKRDYTVLFVFYIISSAGELIKYENITPKASSFTPKVNDLMQCKAIDPLQTFSFNKLDLHGK